MSTPHPDPATVEPLPRTRRSVFGNYVETRAPAEAGAVAASSRPSVSADGDPGCADLAVSRSFVHQFLARAFAYPAAATWAWLCDADIQAGLLGSLRALAPGDEAALVGRGRAAQELLRPDCFAGFHDDYIAAVGHAARGSCPINEIEYGDLRADPLFQPHRLADLAAFYRAFGVEVGADAGERQDHLSVELEFMAVLAAQEAHLLNTAPPNEALAVCRDAQRKFLREHLGRWLPAFVRRLTRAVGEGALSELAHLALAFLENECARVGVQAGSEELLLRPADPGGALCDTCGLAQTLPGSAAPGAGMESEREAGGV